MVLSIRLLTVVAMIFLQNASLVLGSKVILDAVSHTFSQDGKIGLVGRNGAGKSTLLRVLAQEQPLDAGLLRITGGVRIAYVPQHETFTSQLTVLKQVQIAFGDFFELDKRQKEIESAISQSRVTQNELEEYAEICTKIQQFDAGLIERKAMDILRGLGFSHERMHMRVDQLSVGWAMRVYLGQMLLSNADFYLFDEPTNHLDIVCRQWFIKYIKTAPFGFILVSHDRSVINNSCDQICEIDRGNLTWYRGNYDAYEKQKAERLVQLKLAKTAQDKEIERKKVTISRFRASATKAKMVQGLIRELKAIKPIIVPTDAAAVTFTFPKLPNIARKVLTVKDIAYAYGQTTVLDNISFEVERGWRVALVAPNGVGKSTLLRIVVGKLPLQAGYISLAENAKVGYFDQEQSKVLDGTKSVFQNVLQATSVGEQVVRNTLGGFLFSGDDIDKPVSVLSGGEKNRVGMAQILLQGANFLILDEPTNHLDLLSKDVLLKALSACQSTLLFVSHDVDFIDGLATHVIELTHDGAHLFHGNYSDLLAHKRVMGLEQALDSFATVPQTQSTVDRVKPVDHARVRKQERMLQSIEKKIKLLEKKIESKGLSLAQAEYGTPHFAVLGSELQSLQSERDSLLEDWETLVQESDLS